MTNVQLVVDLTKEISAETLQAIVANEATGEQLGSLKDSKTMHILVYAILVQSNLVQLWKGINKTFECKVKLPSKIEASIIKIIQYIEGHVEKTIFEVLPIEIAQQYVNIWADTDGYISMIDSSIEDVESHVDIMSLKL